MNNDALVTPYLKHSIRTMRQVCMDIAEREGIPPPDCHACERREICLLVERNHRRLQKKEMLAAARMRH